MAKSKWETVKEKLVLVEAWARDGLTDEQIMAKLGISKPTFYDYVKKYPNFANALKRGKEEIDIEVENALLKSAMGYYYTEQTVTNKGEVVTVEKYEKPSNTAQIFWLKNRKRLEWRDKQEIEHSGEMVFEVKPNSLLTPEE